MIDIENYDDNNIFAKIGFKETENKPQTFGVATIYTATKA